MQDSDLIASSTEHESADSTKCRSSLTRTQIIIAAILTTLIALVSVVILTVLVLYCLPAFWCNSRSSLSPVQQKLQSLNLLWKVNFDGPSFQHEASYQLNQHPDMMVNLTTEPNYLQLLKQAITDPTYQNATRTRFSELLSQINESKTVIPRAFDARERWPKCLQIRAVHDQSSCGSCWAIAIASTITDRMCIKSQNNYWQNYISANHLVFCCAGCGQCGGSTLEIGFTEWVKHGLVEDGCMPYEFNDKCGSPCPAKTYIKSLLYVDHLTATTTDKNQCPTYCRKEYAAELRQAIEVVVPHQGKDFYSLGTYDYYFNEIVNFTTEIDTETNDQIDLELVPNLDSDTHNKVVQLEIMQRGPVATCFTVYEDFLYYKSGIYSYTAGNFTYGHCVKVIGWGEDPVSGQSYWILVNSWGKAWGEDGFARIAMVGKKSRDSSRDYFNKAGRPVLSDTVNLVHRAVAGTPDFKHIDGDGTEWER